MDIFLSAKPPTRLSRGENFRHGADNMSELLELFGNRKFQIIEYTRVWFSRQAPTALDIATSTNVVVLIVAMIRCFTSWQNRRYVLAQCLYALHRAY